MLVALVVALECWLGSIFDEVSVNTGTHPDPTEGRESQREAADNGGPNSFERV